MDGVLIREEHAVPGAIEFLARLIERGKRFLVLTNNSTFTPRDLAARLALSGLEVPDVGAGDGNISGRSTSVRVGVRHR
jgi:NagD protein